MSEVRRMACLTLAFSTLGAAAGAVTVTFDGLPYVNPLGPGVYIENGVTVSGDGDLGYYDTPGALHVDDSGTAVSSNVTFAMTGPFVPVSFEIRGLGSAFCGTDAECSSGPGQPYGNLVVSAESGGSMTFEDRLYSGDLGVVSSYFFPVGLGLVDSMRISAVLPDGQCWNYPCGHFNIDNVTLAPVPVPAAGLLLLGAIGGIGFVARGRSHRSERDET